MKQNDQPMPGSYVLKVGEENRRYAQELLGENEKLRGLVAALKSEKQQLEERLQQMDRVAREHEVVRGLLTTLETDKISLLGQLRRVREELDRHLENQDRLQKQLAQVEVQNRRFSEEFVAVEQQNNNLTNLYVASYRLHGTLDRKDVLNTIQEILANLVGSEEQGIFEVTPDGTALSLVASVGIDAVQYREIRLGAGPIGRAGLSGNLYVVGPDAADSEEETLTACIPLKLNERVTGVIALFRLLPQKAGLEAVDHELFDLLATHAATALYCTGLHTKLAPGASRP
jgi:hypothetical protein